VRIIDEGPLQRVIDDGGDESAFLVNMQPNPRKRSRDGLNVNNLLQGRDQKNGGYPGGSSVHSADAVTVQLHNVEVTDYDHHVIQGATAVRAVWVPKRLTKGSVVQDD
jgi:hypothetical protein